MADDSVGAAAWGYLDPDERKQLHQVHDNARRAFEAMTRGLRHPAQVGRETLLALVHDYETAERIRRQVDDEMLGKVRDGLKAADDPGQR